MLRLCLFLALFAEYRVKPVYNSHPKGYDKVTIIYRVTAIDRSTLQKNIRQLKILASCR